MSTLTFGSYDGPPFHLVHSSNGFLDHIPEPSGCLHIGKLSPSPHISSLKPKLQQPEDASTSRRISQAEKCGDMAAVSACCCLSCLAASQHPHTPLSKAQATPSHILSWWTFHLANRIPRIRASVLFHGYLSVVQISPQILLISSFLPVQLHGFLPRSFGFSEIFCKISVAVP